jgi:monoamine oxidase
MERGLDLRMTRRDFVRTAAASTLYGIGCGNRSGSSGGGPFDVAVIGAGPAGIAAARALAESGRSFVVLEARERVGGRAYTDNESFPDFPVDIGGGWFQQVVATGPGTTFNPLYDLAIASGRAAELGIVPDPYQVRIYSGPRTLATVEQLVDPLATFAALNGAVLGYGASSGCDPMSCDPSTFADLSAAEAGRLVGLTPSTPWYDFASTPLVNENGATLDQLSALDQWLLECVEASDGAPDHYLIRTGMGNFIRSLLGDIPVRLGTPVTAIDWGGSGGVSLTTPAGIVRAQSVIVTVPVGVLASGQIAFAPELPGPYLATLDQLRMGVVEKLWLHFSEPIFDVSGALNYYAQLVRPAGTPADVVFNFFGASVALCICGGPVALDLHRRGRDAMVAFAKESAAELFGPTPSGVEVRAVTSSWYTEEYTRGSYTYAIPGGVGARSTLASADLARDLLGSRVFFAGEAAAPLPMHSSLHGAFVSGERAAAHALAAL